MIAFVEPDRYGDTAGTYAGTDISFSTSPIIRIVRDTYTNIARDIIIRYLRPKNWRWFHAFAVFPPLPTFPQPDGQSRPPARPVTAASDAQRAHRKRRAFLHSIAA